MSAFLTWWQHLPEKMNPVFFKIGGFSLHYYGLMYLVAFAVVYLLAIYRIKREKRFRISADEIQNLMIFMMFGVIVGGRLGYVIIYNPAYYLKHPLEIFLPFNFSNGFTFTGISGMSFHGGLIGVRLNVVTYSLFGISLIYSHQLFPWVIHSAASETLLTENYTAGSLLPQSACISRQHPVRTSGTRHSFSKRSLKELSYLLFCGICEKSEHTKAPCFLFTSSAMAWPGFLSNISASRIRSLVLSFYPFPWGNCYAVQ